MDLGFLMQKSLMQKKVKSAKTGLHVQMAEMQKAVLRSKLTNPKMQKLKNSSKTFIYFY